jgi:hypothetical protein
MEVGRTKVGYVAIWIILMLTKLIYLVRQELSLSKPKLCPVSRRIGFLDRAGIIEFGSGEKRIGLQYLVVAF